MKSLIGRIMIEAQKQRVRRVHHPRPGHTFVEDHPRIGGHAFAVFSLPGLQIVGVSNLLLPEVLASHCTEPQERLRIGLLQMAQHDYSPDRWYRDWKRTGPPTGHLRGGRSAWDANRHRTGPLSGRTVDTLHCDSFTFPLPVV